jgi:hypothetical protein
MKPPRVGGKGVDVRFGQRGGDAVGGFDLKVIPGQKKGAYRMEHTGTSFKGLMSGLELPIGAHGAEFPSIP